MGQRSAGTAGAADIECERPWHGPCCPQLHASWQFGGETLVCAPSSPPPPCASQVRFFQVSESELESLRERFAAGQYDINIEHKTFSMHDYVTMVSGESQTG